MSKYILRNNTNQTSKNALAMLKEYEDHIGELVLYDYRVVRFVGLDLDDDEDYYYIFQDIDRLKEDNNGVFYSSGCISFTSLKEVLDSKKYDSMLKIWDLNISSNYE